MSPRYASAAAFRQALETQIRLRSQRSGMSIVRLRKAVTFDRLLARLLDVAPNRWVLKGALALDFRLGAQARATMDMDLARYDDADTATVDLLAAQARDLGDYFAFSIERTDRLDALREGAAVRYHVHAELAGRTFERVVVDVGFSERPVDETHRRPELITAPDLLSFAGIAPITVPVISLEYQIAEKLHAYTRGYGEAGMTQSTRVKDLVDLVLIADLASFAADRLRDALADVFSTRRMQPLPSRIPQQPESWRQPYATLAKGVGIDPDLTVGHAHVAAFLDPLLAPTPMTAACWDRAEQCWCSLEDDVERLPPCS